MSVQVILPKVQDSTSAMGAFLAGRLGAGGCSTSKASGVFFWINTGGTWSITGDLGEHVVQYLHYFL